MAGGARRAAWIAACAAVLIGVAALPSVRARAKALPMLLDAIGVDVPRPLAPAVLRREISIGGVPGDLYVPGGPAPPVVLVHGVAPQGKDDPRLVRLAGAVARAGRVVFVPALTLAERRFAEEDLRRIVHAALALEAQEAASGPASLLGISYGGSLALVAAADPRLAGHLAQVAVFGAYFDLVGVIQAVTTGVSVVGGRRFPWNGPARAEAVLRLAAADLLPDRARDDLLRALATEDPEGLGDAARSMYALLTNRDPGRSAELAAHLSGGVRAVLGRFSPSSVAGQITAPVVAMHSTDDPAVPFGEAARLAQGLPGARVVVVRGFRHVDFRFGSRLGPALRTLSGAWRFATWFLQAQE